MKRQTCKSSQASCISRFTFHVSRISRVVRYLWPVKLYAKYALRAFCLCSQKSLYRSYHCLTMYVLKTVLSNIYCNIQLTISRICTIFCLFITKSLILYCYILENNIPTSCYGNRIAAKCFCFALIVSYCHFVLIHAARSAIRWAICCIFF